MGRPTMLLDLHHKIASWFVNHHILREHHLLDNLVVLTLMLDFLYPVDVVLDLIKLFSI